MQHIPMKRFMNIVMGMISENVTDKDHHQALSCIDQAIKGSAVTEQNAERMRNDTELLVIDALRYGDFKSADYLALTRIKTSLQQASDYPNKKKAETVEHMREMLKRFA